MSDLKLIEAVKTGNSFAVTELIESGADVNQQDENGWTPLNWAAGKGDIPVLKSLLDHGADVLKTGRDQRTPYTIALAAGQAEAARLLRDAEAKTGATESNRPERPYCKAVILKQARQYPAWSESRINWKQSHDDERQEGAADTLADDDVVFLHRDLSVTHSMWHGENVIFNQVTPDWEKYCREALNFNPPDDLDLLALSREANA
jgi:ankyrin repeat protein